MLLSILLMIGAAKEYSRRRRVSAGPLKDAALYSAKLSLISAVLFAFATIAIVTVAYSSSHFNERNIHLACCLTVSGIAFMYAASP